MVSQMSSLSLKISIATACALCLLLCPYISQTGPLPPLPHLIHKAHLRLLKHTQRTEKGDQQIEGSVKVRKYSAVEVQLIHRIGCCMCDPLEVLEVLVWLTVFHQILKSRKTRLNFLYLDSWHLHCFRHIIESL